MSTDEKYNIIFDLLAKAKERDGLDVVRLRNEIQKEIEAGDKTFGKFLELMESFQDVLPKEKQRYNVAIKALATTSGLSRQNVLESTDNQLEELKILEKGVFSALTGFRDELRIMEFKSKDIKSEIAKLREKIAEFEKEEKEILLGMAAREREMMVVEDEVRKVFKDVGAEITDIRKKIEEFTGQKVSSQPITPPDFIESRKRDDEKVSSPSIMPPDFIESHKLNDKKEDIEEISTTEETSEPQDAGLTRTCSRCGGHMSFYNKEAMWMCYSCGNEEKDNSEGASEFTIAKETASALEPAPAKESATAAEHKSTPVASKSAAAPSTSSPPVKRPSSRKKACPVCRKQMSMDEEENIWRCPFCDYQRREF